LLSENTKQEVSAPAFALESKDGVQPELFELLVDGHELLVDDEQAAKVFTTEVVARNRARFAGILRCLGEGMSQSAIARAFQVSRNTLAAIVSRRPELVEQERRLAAGRMAVLARACSERLLESIDCIPHQVLPIVMGIATEKSLLLDGRPTAITESKRDALSPAEVNAYIDRLASARPGSELELGTADHQSAAPDLQPVAPQAPSVSGAPFGVSGPVSDGHQAPAQKGGGGGSGGEGGIEG
jgi:hypothetical protein